MAHDEHLTADIVDREPALPAADAAAVPQTGPERRCILTGAHGPRAVLIRLAIGPDRQVAADLSGRLPGRGAWISADRGALETALRKGKLKGALARAFKANDLKLADDLPEQIAAGLERRALDRLGLENKAGNLIWGHERIGEAIIKGKIRLLMHAADARPDGTGKLEAKRRGASPETISITLPVGRDQLSMALGRENVVHAAISDAAGAARIIETLERWAAFNGSVVARDGAATGDEKDEEQVDAGIAGAAAERH